MALGPFDLFRVVRTRLRALIARNAVVDEIHEEVEFHLDERTREHERRGLPAADARRAAVRRFGNPRAIKDRGYDVRGGGVMESILQDVRYGIRLLVKQRGFSIVALLTLALGTGATTAIFCVIDAALIRPLPYPHPEQLVRIALTYPDRLDSFQAPSVADMELWRAGTNVFAQLATARGDALIGIDGDTPERLTASLVQADYLPLYGVRPTLGRGFTTDDERLGADPVVMIGYRYWQSRYHGDPAVIGRTIRFSTGSATIVGIVPEAFSLNEPIWRPLQLNEDRRRARQYGIWGRLKDGVPISQAQRELDALAARLQQENPDYKGRGMIVWSLYERTTAVYLPTIRVLAGAVGFILLIACVNVASLQLARGATRQAELAVRASIGAGRGRLIRQLLVENVVLSLGGAALGALVAWLLLDTLVANIPISLSSRAPVHIDLRVLGFAAAVAIATGVLFGLLPALRLSRVAPGIALGRASRGVRQTLSRRTGGALLLIEVAAAVVLLAGGGLMLRSFEKLGEVELGFDSGMFVTIDATTVDPAPQTVNGYYPALLERLRALPDVAAAGATNELPLSVSYSVSRARADNSSEAQSIEPRTILPGYFEAVGVPLRSGRLPDERDRTSGAEVVVLSEMAARQLFPSGSALGHRVEYSKAWYDVIGVVGDVSHKGPERPQAAQIYLPAASQSRTIGPDGSPRAEGLIVIVRPRNAASLSSSAFLGQLRAAAHAVGPRVVIRAIKSGSDWWSAAVLLPRQRTVLLALLGGLGLLLALVGVFGVTSFAVARRTPEIGIRLAFGARPIDVVGRMVGDAVMPIAAGIVVGLAGAAFATQLISTFLFQTTARDPLTFAAVAGVLAVTGCAAAWLPARRAARIDPVIALRAE